jgi:adaptin ear-binding coat-associated protein 1/2
VWVGSMEIVEKRDNVVYINLVDAVGKLFATCPIREDRKNPVERALDSSRYFVLRIEHPETKKTVVIGIGFIDRGEAFDFQSTVADSRAKIKMEKNIAQNKVDWGPDIDFTMKDDESIEIKLPTASLNSPSTTSSSPSLMGDDGDISGGILAPPPQSGGRRRRRGRGRKKAAASSSVSSGLQDIFDVGVSTTTTVPANTSSTVGDDDDDLGDIFS